MPRTLVPSQPSCRVQSASSWVLTHLWDLWAQRVPPDPLAQAVLAPPWGLPDLEAHLFQGALGARVCLERPWCALRASGPGGRRVWLWSRKNRETFHEGGLPQRQDGSSLPSSALGDSNSCKTRVRETTLRAHCTAPVPTAVASGARQPGLASPSSRCRPRGPGRAT